MFARPLPFFPFLLFFSFSPYALSLWNFSARRDPNGVWLKFTHTDSANMSSNVVSPTTLFNAAPLFARPSSSKEESPAQTWRFFSVGGARRDDTRFVYYSRYEMDPSSAVRSKWRSKQQAVSPRSPPSDNVNIWESAYRVLNMQGLIWRRPPGVVRWRSARMPATSMPPFARE